MFSILPPSRWSAKVDHSLTRALSEPAPSSWKDGDYEQDHISEELDDARHYPILYRIQGKHAQHAPLFIFGIADTVKAQLATIILERLKNHRADYEGLLIFADQADRPRPVLARLSNVGGEQIASLDARDDIERKILRKVA